MAILSNSARARVRDDQVRAATAKRSSTGVDELIAALLAGRKLRGWRGRRATRWLYAGALLLLLAYAGSRFVMQFVLGRPVD